MTNEAVNYESHPFYADMKRNRQIPCWFIGDATREEAEEILICSIGNALMRKHSSFLTTGKYVITLRKDTLKGRKFNHYLVLNTKPGFLLDIDNEHHPMNCLSQVMDCFVQLIGRGCKPVESTIHDHESKLTDSWPSGYLRPDRLDLSQAGSIKTVTPKANEKGGKPNCNPFSGYVNMPTITANRLHEPERSLSVKSNEHHSYKNVQQIASTSLHLNSSVSQYVNAQQFDDAPHSELAGLSLAEYVPLFPQDESVEDISSYTHHRHLHHASRHISD